MAISNQELQAQLLNRALNKDIIAARKSAALSQEVQKNPNLKISENGLPRGDMNIVASIADALSNNPVNANPLEALTAIRNNAYIQAVLSEHPELTSDALAQSVSMRANAKAQGKPVYDPFYGDKSPVEQVEGANRDDNWFKQVGHDIWENTAGKIDKAIGTDFMRNNELKTAIADKDKKLSQYPTEVRSAAGKYITLLEAQKEYQELDFQSRQAGGARSAELEDLKAKQLDRIKALSESMSDAEKQAFNNYGEEFMKDMGERQALKDELKINTPRYTGQVAKDLDIAQLDQEYLARGKSTSFTDPESWSNGYVLRYMGKLLSNYEQSAASVAPWLAINAIGGGAVGMAGRLLLGRAISKSAAMAFTSVGLGTANAFATLDENIDSYFEQHGTTDGFNELISGIAEGVAYMFDMYGSAMAAKGMGLDLLLKRLKKEAMSDITNNLTKSAADATRLRNSAPMKIGVHAILDKYNLGTLTSYLGNKLKEHGINKGLLYGGASGSLEKWGGRALEGTGALAKHIQSSSVALATENMMSETTRQIGRQNGMDWDAVLKSGAEGLVAGPMGKGMGTLAGWAKEGARQGIKAYVASKELVVPPRAHTEQQMYDIEQLVKETVKDGSNVSKVKLIDSIENDIATLEQRKDKATKKSQLGKVRKKLAKQFTNLTIDLEGDEDTLPSVEAVRNATKDRSKQVENELKEYEKELRKFENFKAKQSEVDATINKQIDTLRKYQEQLGIDEVDLSHKSFIEASSKGQNAILEKQSYSPEEKEAIKEDLKGSLKAEDVSDNAFTRIRNVFGTTAAGRTKAALDKLDPTERASVVEELNKAEPDYEKIAKTISTATNAGKSASNILKDVFRDQDNKIAEYRKNLLKNKIDPRKLTVDELRAIAPTETSSYTPDELNKVLEVLASDNSVAELANPSAIQGGKARDYVKNIFGPKLSPKVENIITAIAEHNKNIDIERRSVTGKNPTQTEDMEKEDLLVTDSDTGAITKYSDNVYRIIQQVTEKAETYEDLSKAIKMAEKNLAKDFPGKDVALLNKSLREYNPIKKAFKNKQKAGVNTLSSIDQLTYANMLDMGITDTQAMEYIRAVLKNRIEYSEKEAKKALKKPSFLRKVRTTKAQRYEGYSTISEQMSKARQDKLKADLDQTRQNELEQLRDRADKYDATFLFKSDDSAYKAALSIMAGSFSTLIDKTRNASTEITTDEMLQYLSEDVQFLQKKANGTNIEYSISEYSLEQLQFLIDACDMWSRLKQNEPFFATATKFFTAIQLRINELKDTQIKVNSGRVTALWGANLEINLEKFTVDSYKEKVYQNFNVNQLEQVITLLPKLGQQQLTDEAFRDVFDVFSQTKSNFGLKLLSKYKFSDKVARLISNGEAEQDQELYEIIDYVSDRDENKDNGNLWGWINQAHAAGIASEGIESYDILENLQKSEFDDVRRFFTIEGETLDINTWRERFKTAPKPTQNNIVGALLSQKYILERLFKLKQTNGEDAYKGLTGEDFIRKLREETPKVTLDDMLQPSRTAQTGTIFSNLGKKPKNDKQTTSDKVTNIAVKITLAGLLESFNILETPNVTINLFALNSIFNINETYSYLNTLINSLYRHGGNLTQTEKLGRLAAAIAELNRNKHFAENVQKANETAFDETSKIPDASWINGYIGTAIAQDANLNVTPLAALVPANGTQDLSVYLKQNWGNLIALSGLLDGHLDSTTGAFKVFPDDVRDIAGTSKIYSLLSYTDISKANYRDFVPVDADTITIDSLPSLLDILYSWDNFRTNRSNVVQFIKEQINTITGNEDQVLASDAFKLTKFINDSIASDALTSILKNANEASLRVLVRALANVINIYQIRNTVRTLEGITDVFSQSDNLAEERHQISPLINVKEEDSNESQYFNYHARKAFTLYRNGLSKLLSMNPELKANDYIHFYEQCSEAVRGAIVRPDDEFGELEFTLNGNIHEYAANTCAAVALSMMPRFNTNPNDDYITELAAQYGVAVADTFSDKSKHLCDASTTIISVGSEVARILGYKKGNPLYERIAARLGAIAMISLWKGGMGIKPVWINKDTGAIIQAESAGEQKANCIPAFQLDQSGLNNQETINNAITITQNSTKLNLADQLLDTDIHGDESIYADKSILHNINGFVREWYDVHDKQLDVKSITTDHGKLDLSNLINPSAISVDRVTDVRDDDGRVLGKVIKVGNYALIMFDKKQGIPQPFTEQTNEVDYVVLKGKAILKTDFNNVTPKRMLTLAMQADKGIDVHIPTVINTFKPLLHYDDQRKQWSLKYTLQEVSHFSESTVEELCRKDGQLTTLGAIIYQNSRYGSDPKARSGLDSANVFKANKEDLKTVLKDAEALLSLINNYAKNKDPDLAYQKLYFNEINTVNNRLLVDSKRFNYREFKHWRLLTTVSDAHTKAFNASAFDETQKALFAAPILANLGLDVDKMWDTADILDCWQKLIQNDKFQELLGTVRTKLTEFANKPEATDVYDEVLKAIKKYNSNKNDLIKYRVYKAKKGEYTDKEPAVIKESLASAVALTKLNDIMVGSRYGVKTEDSFLNFLINNKNANVNQFWQNLGIIKGYDITFEVDGLTNGPSFKNLFSALAANTDAFSALYLGATGTSDNFTSIVQGYMQQGILDTYLSSGKLSKESLIYDALIDYYHNNWDTRIKPMAYLNTLYGKGDGDAPDSFLTSFAQALDTVLSRDFMKPITMVIGYEAGKASVILTAIKSLDEQFSKQVGATGNLEVFKHWYEGMKTFMEGDGTILLDYVDSKGNVLIAKLDIKTDTLHISGKPSIKVDNLDSDTIRHLSIAHAKNSALLGSLTNIFGQMYDNIARNKEIVQGPYEALTEATKSICDAFDICMQKAIEKVFQGKDDGISYTDVMNALTQISKELKKNFSTNVRVGVEKNRSERALLDLSKEDRDTLVGKAFNQYTITKDGKYFLNVKSGFAARVSRGAGVVPMDIHSYDSSVMHVMLEQVMNSLGDRVLTIHDAVELGLMQGIAAAPQVTSKNSETYEVTITKQADSILKANKAHYGSQFKQISTLIDMLENLEKALNNIAIKNAFNLSDEEKARQQNSLEGAYNNLYIETLNLINLKFKFLNEERAKTNLDERLHDFQYCFVADANGKAIGAYVPDNADIDAYKHELSEYIGELQKPKMYQYQVALNDALTKFIQINLRGNNAALLDTDGRVRQQIFNNASDIDSLVDSVFKYVNTKSIPNAGRMKSDLRNALNTALLDAQKTSPREQHIDEIVTAYKDRNQKKVNLTSSSIDRLFNVAHASVENGLFHINDEADFGRIYTKALYNRADTATLLGRFDALRRMTGLNLSQQTSDNQLIQLFYNHYKMGEDKFAYSTKIPAKDDSVVLYADGLDSEALLKQFQKHSLKDTIETSTSRNLTIDSWATNYYQHLNQLFNVGRPLNVVITMRSVGDVLNALAINHMQAKGELKNVNLVIIPAISNLTNQSVGVDKETAILQVLREQVPAIGAMYVTGTHASHNTALQSFIMGMNINKAEAEYGLGLKNNQISLLRKITSTLKNPRDPREDRVISYYKGTQAYILNTGDFRMNGLSKISRRDEFGRHLSVPNSEVEIPIYTDMYTHGISGEMPYSYDPQILAEDYRYSDKGTSITPDQFIRVADRNFENVLGDNSQQAVVIETDAEGNILEDTLYKMSEIFPRLNEAVAIAKKRRSEYINDYYKSSRRAEDWNKALMPLVVPVADAQFSSKYFIFKVTIDNSITGKELYESLERKGSGTTYTMYKPRVREGSKLDIMLNGAVKENANYLRKLERILNDYGELPETRQKRTFIDIRNIANSQKTSFSSLGESLEARNIEAMHSIAAVLQDRGVTSYSLPIQDAYWYNQQDRAIHVANNMNTQVIVLGELSREQLESLKAAQTAQENVRIHSIASDKAFKPLTQGKNSTSVHHYTGYATEAEEAEIEPFTDLGYLTSLNPANDTMLRFEDAGQTFTDLMNTFIADDEARGVDTSLVRETMPVLSDLVSLTRIVRVRSARGIRASRTFTENVGNPLEREAVIIGEAVGTQSQSEAFMHEMLHTLWKHISLNDPALRKKLTDLYNFVQRNLQYRDYTEGRTFANEAIHDAVFNTATLDNVEEFLCYYLTNRAFHDAVTNMAARRGSTIDKVLASNTRGIFRKILNFVRSLFGYKETKVDETYDIPGLVQEAAEVAIKYNNAYWLRKQNIVENATQSTIEELVAEETQNPLDTVDDTMRKIIDLTYEDSSFTKAIQSAISGSNFSKFIGLRGERQRALNEANSDENTVDESIEQSLLDLKENWEDAQDGFINNLLASLEGVSQRQFNYLILRTRGKAQIDQRREQVKSVVNSYVKKILEKVNEKHYEPLVRYFVRNDVSCLFDNTEQTPEEVCRLITNNQARERRISYLEREVQSYRDPYYLLNCARGLAHYLITGFNPTGIGYRNVYEIMARAGSSDPRPVDVTGQQYHVLDQLVTLYALRESADHLEFFDDIPVKTLHQLARLHNGIKQADNADVYAGSAVAHYHVPKGEVHQSTGDTHRYDIVNEKELAVYEWTGYKKVDKAVLDPYFRSQYPDEKFVMVRAPYKSEAVTTAGIFSMTNIFKGRSTGGLKMGNFTRREFDTPFRNTQESRDLESYINRRIMDLNSANPHLLTQQTSGNLQLNFNFMDGVSGATFEINPIDAIKQRDSHLTITSALGDLFGSVLERTETPRVNEMAVRSIMDIYENSDQKEAFRWISPTSENEEYRELYEHLPYEVQQLVQERFGNRGLPVHIRSLNTVFGYRNMSANDTKTFIESERRKQNNADQLIHDFSVSASNILYNGYLGNTEAFMKWLAKVGKENIVIKGLTTSIYNILSNCTLLSMNGLSAKQVITYQLEALRQFDVLRQYNYQLAVLRRKRLMGEYTDADARQEASINRSREALPIYPLYHEGILGNTIAEDLTESEGITKGLINKFMPRGKLRTVVHNLALDNESILYRILADIASLGDVTGKYALYKHNISKHMSERDALKESLSTFIDYSNPLPRELQLADDFAVLPFMKYTLGIQSVIAKTLVKHPDRSLGWLFGANMLTDTPNVWESLLWFDTVWDKVGLPGSMFADSIKCLPPAKFASIID